MPLTKVRAFLDEHHIKYVVISHSKAYTAQGIAAIAHIPGQELAKTVIVKLDGALAMAVLPASYQVDLLALKKAVGVNHASLASEGEFKAGTHLELIRMSYADFERLVKPIVLQFSTGRTSPMDRDAVLIP